MKTYIMIGLLGLSILTADIVMAQVQTQTTQQPNTGTGPTKEDKKDRKAEKKELKAEKKKLSGNERKAMKKEVKAEAKDNKSEIKEEKNK